MAQQQTESMTDRRFADTVRFYSLLNRLEARIVGSRRLANCHGRMNWPPRGIYFFYESGEARTESGAGLRVVRVGTHAITSGSRSTLWKRLSQHRGSTRSAGGNHRGSIFRLLVGVALAGKENAPLPPSWGVARDTGSAARRLGITRDTVKDAEAALESQVSRYIGNMPFLWLNVGDAPSPDSQRSFIERNAIALLSGYRSPAVDYSSPAWLGQYSDRERVRLSGLWNNNHVDEIYDPSFLDALDDLII